MHVFLLGKSAPFVAEVGFFAALISESSLSLLFFFFANPSIQMGRWAAGRGRAKGSGQFSNRCALCVPEGWENPTAQRRGALQLSLV